MTVFLRRSMNKCPSIFGALRPSLLGDIIISTTFLNYLEKVWPRSYKVAYIDKKCQQILPFLFNHPLIDKIQVSNKSDEITQEDVDFINKFDIKYHPFPQHPYGEDFYNTRDIIHETFLMNYEIGKGYINPIEWNKMEREDKFPRLEKWFDIEKRNKTIAIWPSSGYNLTNGVARNLRSPTKEWWEKLVETLSDYKIIQLGMPNSELLNHSNIIDCRNLNLFEAIKISLSCDINLGTDSGSSWLVGAYGHPQIILFTNYNLDHFTNFDAFVPTNYKNNAISICGKNKDINNIEQEEVLSAIKQIQN